MQLGELNFKVLFNLSPNPYVLIDRDLTIVEANEAYLQVTGRRREDILGQGVFDAFPGKPDDPDHANVRQLRASFEGVLATGEPDSLALIHYAIPRETPDGLVFEDRYWSATHTPVVDEDGKVALILQHTVDVTELQELKEALQEAEAAREEALPSVQVEEGVLRRAQVVQETNRTLQAEREHLNRLFEQAPGFVCFLRGREHVFELSNSAYNQLVGHRDILGKSVREALPEVEGQGYLELLDCVYETGEPFVGREMEIDIQRKPGGNLETVYLDFVYQPIVEPDGSVSGIFVQGYEVTEQKRARDELWRYRDQLEELVHERTAELEKSQAALHQSQKMEAIGKLTGGVAHDFNNLLQVIGGNLELLQRDSTGDERTLRRLKTAIRAVERGASLASQLLAFGRRQPLEPRVVNVGQLLQGMDEMLRRALGEPVEVETIVGGSLWNTFVDPHQLENVILNLAINARDAMEGEGKLTIEAGNTMLDDRYAMMNSEVSPGQYVLIAITDTGKGMRPEVAQRVFEPFFTTKSEEEGTGLGLSMAYGFVKQTGGHIKIYSEEGEGTTVKVYLPRTLQEVREEQELLTWPVEGGNETILVVEDDAEVRATVVEMLSDLGYNVLKASDGESALAVLRSGVRVDLLFTDVVMPGPVRSPDLARQARRLMPDLEVLFTSGYTENAVVHGGRLDPGISLLSKPYSRDDLARKVRQQLGTQPGKQRSRLLEERREPSPAPSSDRSLNVLLVEDDEGIQLFVSEAIGELGHRVVVTSSAEEAMEAFGEGSFDVLFADIILPGMSGLELARELQEQQSNLQVVIASGQGRDGGPMRDGEIEDVFFLPKPFNISAIENVLEQAAELRFQPE